MGSNMTCSVASSHHGVPCSWAPVSAMPALLTLPLHWPRASTKPQLASLFVVLLQPSRHTYMRRPAFLFLSMVADGRTDVVCSPTVSPALTPQKERHVFSDHVVVAPYVTLGWLPSILSHATSVRRPASLCDETVPSAAAARQTTASTHHPYRPHPSFWYAIAGRHQPPGPRLVKRVPAMCPALPTVRYPFLRRHQGWPRAWLTAGGMLGPTRDCIPNAASASHAPLKYIHALCQYQCPDQYTSMKHPLLLV
ncbi:hypothetical protein IWX90DRAFT_156538 [Phyllosticta citrichinensis]|uniref:Uncharacterized protein n=1 Tax=Phyllosticta citrichinensis TaxID=1130410 RepID=A0ABR1Y004_9PEZI